MKHVRLIGRYWVPVVAYATLIFYGSSLSHPEDTFPSFLEGLSDKVLHMLEFGLLGVLCYRAFGSAAGAWGGRYALPLAIALAIFYGFTDELHQALVPEREADGWDFLADAGGATIGTVAWHLVRQMRDRPGMSRPA